MFAASVIELSSLGDLCLTAAHDEHAEFISLDHLDYDHLLVHDHFDGLFRDHSSELTGLLDGDREMATSGEGIVQVPFGAAGTLPVLQSNAAATVKIYLDFDGNFESVWGGYSNVSTPVFDTDGNGSALSNGEINQITEIWRRVAEDFSPFNVDVTTVDPGNFSNGKAIRVAMGGNGSWIGGYGGVAYVDSFTNSLSNTVHVFTANLANNAKYIAEAASHEVGHALGLYHQSEYNAGGTKVADYYAGTGSWAPIMGVGYYREQTTWHNGPNSNGPQSYQNDLAIITRSANGFGYRQDDFGSSLANPTPVVFANGQLLVNGVIEEASDSDVFEFQMTSSTSVTLDVDGATSGANLDLQIDLFDSGGQLVLTSNPADRFDVGVAAELDADTYRLVVRGGGGYGEVGQFTVRMQVINSIPDLQPLADLVIAHSANPKTIALAATDSDGDALSFSADISYIDPLEKLAYDTNQQYGLFVTTTAYDNQRGLQEKYLEGTGGQWFYMLPTGELFQWGGSVAASTKIATFVASYYTNLAKLYDAQAPVAVSFGGTWQIAGNVLSIDPTNGIIGTYQVRVSATDGYASDTETFSLQVTNAAPAVAFIANRTMAASQNQLTVPVSLSDGDGDVVTISATIKANDPIGSLAYRLKQQHGFYAASSYYFNQRGLQEKYFQGNGGNWYYMLPDGATYSWGGSVAASILIGELDSTYYADPTKLFQASNVDQNLANVSITVSGQTLTIDPADGFTGDFVVQVSASDGIDTTTRDFVVTVTNNAPTVTAIGDKTMAASQDTLAVQLAANDSDGDTIQFTAEARGGDSIAALAYQLKQQHGFYWSGSDYYNQRGLQEKYFQGNGGNWYFLLPTGAIYSWGGTVAASTLLGTLNQGYFQNLNTLFNAPLVDETLDDVTLQVQGTTLIINPDPGYTGEFEVVVHASDGSATTSSTFNVTVVNHAPTITSIINQNMVRSQDTLAISLAASDSDGDLIRYSAQAKGGDPIAVMAYQLKQQHAFVSAGSDYFNQRGLQEKYFQGNGGNWYFMLPTGAVYAWGGTVATSTLLGTLDASYHADLTKLFNAQAVNTTITGVTLSVVGNTLTIDPAASFTGGFDVQVTATDGIATATTTFTVTVINHAPTLTEIVDRTIAPSTDTMIVQLSASDVDGDAIQFSAEAKGGDPIGRLAYQLKQQHNFYFSGSDYYNQRGLQEKYFQGNGNNWYFMLPTGAVYAWGGSVAGSTSLGMLDSSYHTSLSKLFNAQPVDTTVSGVTLNIVGNTLTIDPSSGFTGDFDVHVSATDGSATSSTSFTVSVVNHAPIIQSPQNVGVSPSEDTCTFALSGTDIDGDSITWTAQIVPADPAAVLAYQLKQQHGFYSAGSEYYNQRGFQEKYFQGNNGNWYFMLPDGSTYAWGGTVAASPKLGTLDSSYFANLSKLYNAQPVSDPSGQVSLSLSGNQLTIDPANGYTGRFQIQISASDGTATTTMTMSVQVENQAPTVAAISDQTMTSAENSRAIAINAADADGDPVTLSARVLANDPIAAIAYQLKQQHGFYWSGSDYYNQRGLQEKYFQGYGGNWYFMFPDGSTYAWGGTVAASPLLGKLDNSYFANLSKLFNAPAVEDPSGQVSVQIQGNVLTVDPADQFHGNFRIEVTATAGAHTTSRTFGFSVIEAAPSGSGTIAFGTNGGEDGVVPSARSAHLWLSGEQASSYGAALSRLPNYSPEANRDCRGAAWRTSAYSMPQTDIEHFFPTSLEPVSESAVLWTSRRRDGDAGLAENSLMSRTRLDKTLQDPDELDAEQLDGRLEKDEEPFESAEESALSLAFRDLKSNTENTVDQLFDALAEALRQLTN